MSGAPAAFDSMLLAIIADALRILVWQNTKDGLSGTNVPDSIVAAMLSRDPGEEIGFGSAEEFNAWRDSVLQGGD